jgi:hypothetical protein
LDQALLAEVDIGSETERVLLYDASVPGGWTKVQLGYVIAVKEQERIFLKALGVTDCVDFNLHFDPKGKAKALSHMRDQLSQQRSEVRNRYKQRGYPQTPQSVISISDSDCGTPNADQLPTFTPRSIVNISDDECADEGHADQLPTFTPRSIVDISDDDEDDDEVPHPSMIATATRQRVVVKMEETAAAANRQVVVKMEDADQLPPRKRRHVTDSPTPTSPRSYRDGAGGASLSWPADYYVVDVVEGFLQCASAREARVSVGGTFTQMFGKPFNRTTFYQNRQIWESTPKHIRTRCKNAGRTKEGLWSHFMAERRKELNKNRSRSGASRGAIA